MHLYKFEHRDIVKTLNKAGIPEQELYLHKKGGWVKIEIDRIDSLFEFHRKKVSRLIDGKFTDHYDYRVRLEKTIRSMENWAAVVQSFDEWIKGHYT